MIWVSKEKIVGDNNDTDILKQFGRHSRRVLRLRRTLSRSISRCSPENNPLFAVIASTQDGSRTVSIQVKTSSIRNKQGWKLGKDIAVKRNTPGLFVVLVNIGSERGSRIYISTNTTLSLTLWIRIMLHTSRSQNVTEQGGRMWNSDGTILSSLPMKTIVEKTTGNP